MFEIQITIIAQISLYMFAILIFYFTTKMIITGQHDGFDFNIKKQNNLLMVIGLDVMAVLLILVGLHYGNIIKFI